MKASSNPSPLREFHFDPDMRVLGSPAAPNSPLVLMPENLAAAVRRRRAKPAFWLQVHLGFLCEEHRKETRRVSTKWQVGRQPGDWAWLQFADAARFMGSLEAGQGQPVVVSAWAPAWESRVPDVKAFDVGEPVDDYLPRACWWVDETELLRELRRSEPSSEDVQVWRLKPRRQHSDTVQKAWKRSL